MFKLILKGTLALGSLAGLNLNPSLLGDVA